MPLNQTKNANNYISGKVTFFPDNYNDILYFALTPRRTTGVKRGPIGPKTAIIGNTEGNYTIGELNFLYYVA